MSKDRPDQDPIWTVQLKDRLAIYVASNYPAGPRATICVLEGSNITHRDVKALSLNDAVLVTAGPGTGMTSGEFIEALRHATSIVETTTSEAHNAHIDLGQRNVIVHGVRRKGPAQRAEQVSHRDVPRLGEFVLLCVLSKKARESLPGDLAEEFITEIMPKVGLRKARFWYWCQVAKSLGPLIRVGLVSSLFAWVFRQFGR